MLLIYVAWILVLLIVVIILCTVLSFVGSQLPDEHLSEVVRDLPIALDDAFRVMRDLETWQSWSYYCSARLGNYQSEFSYFLCGLDKNDSLCNVFNGFTKRVVHGNIYSVSFDYLKDTSITPNYYFEAARI